MTMTFFTLAENETDAVAQVVRDCFLVSGVPIVQDSFKNILLVKALLAEGDPHFNDPVFKVNLTAEMVSE